MNKVCILISLILSLSLPLANIWAQDTTLTITSKGKVGIGITTPEAKLHVLGGVQFEKVTKDGVERLVLRTHYFNYPERYGIRFANNQVAPFEGEDLGDQFFGFYSGWGANRQYNAIIDIHGKAKNSWGNYLRLTHNGTDGFVVTDIGNIIISPSKGLGNVGVGMENPGSKLAVNGTIESTAGGYRFPDGTVQTTTATGIWKQLEVNAYLTSTFSDKATITITPPSSGGYFVLTFSGSADNLKNSNQTRILIYLNNVANSGVSYPGYVSYFQDSSNGYTRQIPLHLTRIFDNTSTSQKTFYLHAGDSYDGGYTLYGNFIVQWFPGSQQ